MELKRTAVFLGILGLLAYGPGTLILWSGSLPLKGKRVTAKSVCAEDKTLAAAFLDEGEEPVFMTLTECRGHADAQNGKAEQESSVEYKAGYLRGLTVSCFSDIGEHETRDECWEAHRKDENRYREKNRMDVR